MNILQTAELSNLAKQFDLSYKELEVKQVKTLHTDNGLDITSVSINGVEFDNYNTAKHYIIFEA